MVEKKIVLKSKVGLHARPAAMFVKMAGKFSSDILVLKSGREANAKSLLSLISLGAEQGDEILIKVNGNDEKDALYDLLNLVQQSDFE